MNQLCTNFLIKYNLSPKTNLGEEEVGIYWLEKANLLIKQSGTENDKLLLDPSWGIIQFMLDKAYQHTTGSFVLYLTGSKASCEALSRVALEASINILYILNNENRMERIFQYFSTYLIEERKQNEKWKKSITNLNLEDQLLQTRGIEQKEKFLSSLENFLSETSTQVNLKYPPEKTIINTYSKFEDLKRETAYRTFYAAMSSQIHNDAEDLINKLLVSQVNDKEDKLEISKKLDVETENFSRLMLYVSLQYYLESCLAYCAVFSLNDILKDFSQGYNAISDLTVNISKNINPHLFE